METNNSSESNLSIEMRIFAERQAGILWDFIKKQSYVLGDWRSIFVFYFVLYLAFIIKKYNLPIEAEGEITVREFFDQLTTQKTTLALVAITQSWNDVFGAGNDETSNPKFNIDQVREIVGDLNPESFSYLASKNLFELFETSERYSRIPSIPRELTRLVCDLFGKENKKSFLDACAWRGDVLIKQIEKNDHLVAAYMDMINADILSMRVAMIGADDRVDMVNMLTEGAVGLLRQTMRFDRIFIYPPFNMRIDREKIRNTLETANMPFGTGSLSSSLVFIAQILPMLADGGRLIAVLPNGALFRKTDKLFREELLRRGLVSQVIALPEGICSNTNIAINLLVLDKAKNDTVKFIDATNALEKRKGLTNRLMFAEIFKAENMVEVPVEDVLRNECLLSPDKYLNVKRIEYINPVPLGELTDTCFRGCQIRLRPTRDDNNDVDVITLADMDANSNTVSRSLSGVRLKDYPELEGLASRYEVKDGDVLITSRGTSVKFAVVDEENLRRRTIVNENILVIRPTIGVLDPYYLLAYLRSRSGQATLDSLRVGSTVKLLSPASLKQMPISMLDENLRAKISTAYRFRIREVFILNRQFEQIQSELSDLLDKTAEETR